MKKSILSLLFIFASLLAFTAPAPQHVVWTSDVEAVSPTEGVVHWTVNIEDGWHIYGSEMPVIPDMTTYPTTITVTPAEGLVLDGPVTPSVPQKSHFDEMMVLELPWWESKVTFSQKFHLEGVKGVNIAGTISYMACNATSCTAPTEEEFSMKFGDESQIAKPAAENTESAPAAVTPTSLSDQNSLWEPVAEDLNAAVVPDTKTSSMWSIFFISFLGGLLALLTPCVWPMIPMTVSFFLKTTKNRRKAIMNAITYGVSIVVIFLVLGLAITLIFGASKLNELSTSAVFNLIFFALLVVFAISFFGAFDIKLPSKWSNAIDSKAESTSGVLSIFFMAFTLVLVSFSCTGPIIGTLLVEAASEGNIVGPAVGMTGFSLGLAIPFALFAIFPSFLQSMPKSGGWLNSVKVVLGFIELILSLKFLSVADLAYGWRLLDREVFVAIWIVLFILLGMYLIGKLRFSHDSPSQHTSVLGFFLALISFSFAVYLVPGLWGAPLKAISAFAPPLATQDFNLYGGAYEEFDDYDEGMAFAKKAGKPVFVDFTGYGCVNCRKMEMAVFDTQEVRSILERDYVIIRLYVDEKKPLPQPIMVRENDRDITLKTYGDKWSYLQRHKFNINSQPYYVLLNDQGQPLMPPRDYNESVPEFVEWLNQGVANYKK